jgi:antitoxin VapB
MPDIFGIRRRGAAMATAKIFWTGRSQAVRLPKDFRFEGGEVRIRRHGAAVILEPVAHDWGWLDSLAGQIDDDFVRAVNEQPEPQESPALDKLFE